MCQHVGQPCIFRTGAYNLIDTAEHVNCCRENTGNEKNTQALNILMISILFQLRQEMNRTMISIYECILYMV